MCSYKYMKCVIGLHDFPKEFLERVFKSKLLEVFCDTIYYHAFTLRLYRFYNLLNSSHREVLNFAVWH